MYPVEQLDADRRRRMVQEAMARSLPRPQTQSDSPLSRAARQITGPSNDQMEQIFSQNPGLRDVAYGENYGGRPSLYQMGRTNGGVTVQPLDLSRISRSGLERPAQSFMPGESAGIPDFLRRGTFNLLGNVPASGTGLSLPQPATHDVNIGGIQPPQPNESASPATSPRIGYSTAGLTGVDRILARRRALEEADPESKVTDSGEILPPHKTGRLAGLGRGLEVAAQGIDPNHPMFSLGQLVGGGVRGLTSPRSAAKQKRQLDLARLDNDYARGLKLEQEQAQLDAMRGPKMGQMSTRVVTEGEYPGIEAGTEIRTRVDPRTGAITDVVGPNNKPVISGMAQSRSPHYESDSDGYLITVQGGQAKRVTDPQGNPVKVKSKNADGEVVEVEVNGQRLRVTPGQALNYYGQIGAQESKRNEAQAEREAKYNAAKSEYDSLIAAEEAARQEKDRAYKVLEGMRNVTPDDARGRQDIEQAQKAAEAADAFYKTFGEKKKEAARRMQENQVTTTSTAQPYAGRTMSRANLERYAKDHSITVEEAQKQVEAQGVRVQ